MHLVLQNILDRRSCRAFTNEPVRREDLQDIVKAGVYAPSGMNRQTRQFTVLHKRNDIQILTAAMAQALGKEDYDLYRPTALVLVSNEPGNPNSGFDCACALENIFLTAHSLGIGSCWINQMKAVQNVPDVRAMLTAYGIPQDHSVYGMAALGYPDASAKGHKVDKTAQVVRFID
ncbi:MAG: nitroreductase [Clostridia bacterium]|nr:nitroreductase [Clostridia bacterium]